MPWWGWLLVALGAWGALAGVFAYVIGRFASIIERPPPD